MAAEHGGTATGGFVGGIAQNMAANLCGGAIGAACVSIGLSKSNDFNDLANWPIQLAVVGGFVALGFGLNSGRLALDRWRARGRVRRASGGRFALLLARLEGDRGDGTHRETVREAIKTSLGDAVEIVAWPDALKLGDGHDADAEAAARKQAQQWLARNRCDLLVWGRVKGDKVLSLRFTPAQGDAFEARSYGLTEATLDLPVAFTGDLGAAIAARAAAAVAPAVSDNGRYLAPLMRQLIERLEPLARQAGRLPDPDARGSLLFSLALARDALSAQSGTNEDLRAAIAGYSAALMEYTRDRVPLKWATTQHNLGNVLARLGEREAGTKRLQQAIEAYREALKEWTRDRVPLDWALTQTNLGNVLARLGERETGTERLEQAVEAYRAALEERTQDKTPLGWAATQNNLGNALSSLGAREAGTKRLQQAIEAYREALEERARDRVPLDWAATQNNLGNALARLGERETGIARLQQAIATYREALKEWTRDRVPLDWATTQHNLGNALSSLGAREAGTKRLQQAVEAYRKALKERTRDRGPLDWAVTTGDLSMALKLIAERRGDLAIAEQALSLLADAFEVCRDGGHETHAALFEAELQQTTALVARLREG